MLVVATQDDRVLLAFVVLTDQDHITTLVTSAVALHLVANQYRQFPLCAFAIRCCHGLYPSSE